MKGKRGIKPTYEQKKRITKAGLDWQEYLVLDENDFAITLIHRNTGKREVVMC